MGLVVGKEKSLYSGKKWKEMQDGSNELLLYS